jgi:hypothetical protein
MKINNTIFNIWKLDSPETITQRIAMELNTIPKYLWWKNYKSDYENHIPINMDFDASFNVINILTDLENSIRTSRDVFTISDVESTYLDWITKFPDDKKTLISWYIIFFIDYYTNHDLGGNMDPITFLEIEIESTHGGREYDLNFPNQVYNSKNVTKQEYTEEINKNKKQVREMLDQFKQLEKIKHVQLHTLPFTIEKLRIMFTIEFEKNLSIMTLFNISNIKHTITISNIEFYIVAIYANNFFTINTQYKNFLKRYDVQTIKENANNMIIILRSIDFKKKTKKVDLVNIICKPSGLEAGEFNKLPIEFDLSIDKKNSETIYILQEKIEKFIVDIFGVRDLPDYSISSRDNSKIKGSYYIVDKQIFREIFLDMIMNNKLFSVLLYVDERIKVTKYQSSLHCYFSTAKTGTVSFSISNIKENDKYKIQIRISHIDDKEQITFFINQMNNLFNIYFDKEEQILKIYKSFNVDIKPTFENEQDNAMKYEEDTEKITKKKTQKRQGLAEQVPDLFLPLYSRKCANIPRIITESEKLSPKTQIMKYPLYNEGNLEPSSYVCDKHEKFPYPGLRKNTLDNADVFTYIPCCYATDQRYRVGSPYGIYFFDQPRYGKTDHVLYKTSRIIPDAAFGILPEPVVNIFHQEQDFIFYRYGVPQSPNSVLYCILRALDMDVAQINNIRNDLVKLENYNIGKQEMWDLSDTDIQEWLQNDIYLDPKKFIKIIEDFFDITIFLFERDIGIAQYSQKTLLWHKQVSNNGQLSIPYHNNNYILRPLKERIIILFLHLGSDINKVIYPQCEAIVKYNTKSKIFQQIFERDDIDVERIFNMTKNLTFSDVKFFNINTQHVLVEYPNIIFVNQFLDANGQIYAIKIKYKSQYFILFCEPAHPLDINVLDNLPSDTPSMSNIRDICTYLNFKTVKESKYFHTDSYQTYATGYIDNIECFIPLKKLDFSNHAIDIDLFMDSMSISCIFFEYIIQSIQLVESKDEIIKWFDDNCVIDKSIDYIKNLKSAKISIPYITSFHKVFKKKNKICFPNRILLEKIRFNTCIIFQKKIIQTTLIHSFFNTKRFLKQSMVFYGLDTFIYNYTICEACDVGKTIYNSLESFKNSKFFTNKLINNGKVYISQCFSSLDECIVSQKNTILADRMIYIWKNNNFIQYNIDINVHLIIFPSSTGILYITLNDYK